MANKKQVPHLQAVEMPPIKDFLTAAQRNGTELCAADVFRDTLEWIRESGCENVVAEQMVEEYAMSVARWAHLEQMISKYGYIAKHPTTGAPMQSPYVVMAQTYLKQASAIRAEIMLLMKDAKPAAPTTIREVVYGG